MLLLLLAVSCTACTVAVGLVAFEILASVAEGLR